MTGRRGLSTPVSRPMRSDEWFTDYLSRCPRGAKRGRILDERRPRPQDAAIKAAEAYDARTAELLEVIRHESRNNAPTEQANLHVPGLP